MRKWEKCSAIDYKTCNGCLVKCCERREAGKGCESKSFKYLIEDKDELIKKLRECDCMGNEIYVTIHKKNGKRINIPIRGICDADETFIDVYEEDIGKLSYSTW